MPVHPLISANPSLPTSFLDREEFFRSHWKRKPLYLPQALPNFKSPLAEDELAGLACEQMIESRIVLERGATPWELRHGPFKAKDFQKLPSTHWTLLVQAVNHWVPKVSDLLEHFNFLPRHYLDDIMMSYAAEQGSVGAHFDYYDVFILQGTGKRHWKLGEFCSPQTLTREQTPLGILQQFNTVEEYVLEPGDLLYIPQQQAHWCVALEAGLSYSIGFRTPSYGELLNGFCNEVFIQLDASQRLQIPPQTHTATPAELEAQTIAKTQQILENLIHNPDLLRDWLGRYLTEPKYPELECQGDAKKPVSLAKQLSRHTWLKHNESSRFAYNNAGDCIHLFVDGRSSQHSPHLLEFIALLCNLRQIACELLVTYIRDDAHRRLLQSLVNQGAFYFS